MYEERFFLSLGARLSLLFGKGKKKNLERSEKKKKKKRMNFSTEGEVEKKNISPLVFKQSGSLTSIHCNLFPTAKANASK